MEVVIGKFTYESSALRSAIIAGDSKEDRGRLACHLPFCAHIRERVCLCGAWACGGGECMVEEEGCGGQRRRTEEHRTCTWFAKGEQNHVTVSPWMFVIAWLGLSTSFSEVPLALSSAPDNQRLSSTTSPSVYTQYQAQYLLSYLAHSASSLESTETTGQGAICGGSQPQRYARYCAYHLKL
jgi:hypothetical protein